MGFQKSNCNSDVSKVLSHSSTLEYFWNFYWTVDVQKKRGRGKSKSVEKSGILKPFFAIFLLCNKGVVYLQKKTCGKGEMWSLHYHHANELRDQVTLHDRIFSLRILQAGWKNFYWAFLLVLFLPIYLSKVLSKCNWNAGMSTLDECFPLVMWQKNRYISMNTWPRHAFQLVSCTSLYVKHFPRVICYDKCSQELLLKLKMLNGYLNESRDSYLDNYQSDVNVSTSLSSCVSFVSICIFTETDHPPSFFQVFFYILSPMTQSLR